MPDFPVTPVTASVSPAGPLQALGLKDGNVFFNGIDSLVLIEDETGLRRTRVNQGAGRDGHDSLTAAGIRFCIAVFAPASGIDEEPVTGSAHCTLAPFCLPPFSCHRPVPGTSHENVIEP